MKNKGLIVDSQCCTVSFWMYFADPDSKTVVRAEAVLKQCMWWNNTKGREAVKQPACKKQFWKLLSLPFISLNTSPLCYLPQYFTLMFLPPPRINLISGTNILASLAREVLEVSKSGLTETMGSHFPKLLNDK